MSAATLPGVSLSSLPLARRSVCYATLTSLALYGLAIPSSMAGMEIFGWLTAIGVLVLIAMGEIRLQPLLAGDWALLGLFGVGVAGALINTPAPKSVSEIVGLFRFIPLFFLLRAALLYAWGKRTEQALVALSFFAGLIAIYAISQYWIGWDWVRGNTHRAVQIFNWDAAGQPIAFRSAGLLSSPITYAYSAGLLMCFPLAYFMLAGLPQLSRPTRRTLLMGLCGAVMLISVFSSMTRGAWVATVAALLVMSFYLGRKQTLIVIATMALATLMALSISQTLRHRVATIVSMDHNSAHEDRERIWRANYEMFTEYPLLGVGYGENERLIEGYYQRLGLNGQVGHAHNTYMQFLSGTGIVGLALYLFFIGFYLWLCHGLWRTIPESQLWLRTIVLGAIGAQVLLHVGGITECNFKDTEVTHEFMFILAAVGVVHELIRRGGYGAHSPAQQA